MSLDYEQSKEIEALIERRVELLRRVSKIESRLSVLENLDKTAKEHDKEIGRLWLWSLGSIFTALSALVIAVLFKME